MAHDQISVEDVAENDPSALSVYEYEH